MEYSPVSVSKLQAAEDQLVEAINQYFRDGKPIPIHTLVRASHEVLDKLCKYHGKEMGVVKQGLGLIKKEYRDEIFHKVSEAKNFFKHAEDDSDDILQWDPRLNELFLLDACNLYLRLTDGIAPCEIWAYRLWERTVHPELWGPAPEIDELLEKAREIMRSLTKKETFELLKKAVLGSPLMVIGSAWAQ